MNIWLITIGEPILHPNNKLRLHRTGILAKTIVANSSHKVTWWTSTFNHFTKEHMYDTDAFVDVHKNLKMIAIKAKGYKRNISIDRIIDHKQISQKFERLAPLEKKPDIIIAAFPTLGLCQAAIKFGKTHNIPVLIDYRDMWPEVFVDIIPSIGKGLGQKLLSSLFEQTKQVFSQADGLVGITEEFLGLGLKKIGRTKGVLDGVFHLGYLENQFSEIEYGEAEKYWASLEITKENGINICFFGTLGQQFELETAVKAGKTLSNDNIRFIFCGTGDKMSDLQRLASGAKNIVFPGYMSAAQIAALMNISQFGLCPYKPKEAFLNSIPGKAIEYLSAGLKLISSLGDGVLGEFINENQTGVNYESNSVESLCAAIMMAIAGNKYEEKVRIKTIYLNKFKAENVYSEYLKHIENVVERSNRKG